MGLEALLELPQFAHVRRMIGHVRRALPGQLPVLALQFRHFRLQAEMLGGPVVHLPIVALPGEAALP